MNIIKFHLFKHGHHISLYSILFALPLTFFQLSQYTSQAQASTVENTKPHTYSSVETKTYIPDSEIYRLTTSVTKEEQTLESQSVEMARSFIGYPYIFGGNSPTTGFDCSGLVKYIWKEIKGIELSHSVAVQASVATKVTTPSIGDLVVYFAVDGTDDYTHIGIYSGENTVIHAGRSNGEVAEESIQVMDGLRYEFYRIG